MRTLGHLENNALDGPVAARRAENKNAHMEQQPKIVSPELRRRPAVARTCKSVMSFVTWTQRSPAGRKRWEWAPFVVLDSSVADRQFFHRGQRSAVDFSIGSPYLGDVMIELIMPLNAAPSPYSEFLAVAVKGLHHVGLWPDDLTKTWQALKESGFTE